MKNKPIILVIILCILLLLGWAVKHYFFSEVPPAETSNPESITVIPSPADTVPNSMQELKPAVHPSKQQVSGDRSIDPQRISADKLVNVEEKPADLSEQTMSIKKEETKGYEIMSGVNVKRGVVHVQLDQENNRSIEIERNPANSNNEYQLMLKKKF